jgi:hypothetical protein
VNRASGIVLILAGALLAVVSLMTWSRTDPLLEHRDVAQSRADRVASTGPAWRRHSLDRIADTAPATVVVTVPTKAPMVLPQAIPPIPGDRNSRARELQRELRRVGCYSGEINGMWTPETRSAARSFLERMNAALPIDEPDHVLLTLVQRHQGKGCGTCPVGQGVASNGRCLPNALLAQGKTPQRAALPQGPPADRPTTGWSVTTTVTAPQTPLAAEDRMALAGPKIETTPVDPSPAAAAPQQDRDVRPAVARPKKEARRGDSAVGFFQQLQWLLP